MYRRTGGFFGINEALFASALAAMVFSLLACQPLTIVGVTGLISLFNYTIYDIVTQYDPSIYPAFTACKQQPGPEFYKTIADHAPVN